MKPLSRLLPAAFALTVLTAPAMAAAAQEASPLQPGTFTGTGHWKGKGSTTGDYTVETTVEGRSLVSHYNFTTPQGARSETHAIKLSRQGEPFFDILDDKDKVIGKGYCFDSECFYRAELGPMTLEETFSFSKGLLTKFGSKKGNGVEVVWKEVLEAK